MNLSATVFRDKLRKKSLGQQLVCKLLFSTFCKKKIVVDDRNRSLQKNLHGQLYIHSFVFDEWYIAMESGVIALK